MTQFHSPKTRPLPLLGRASAWLCLAFAAPLAWSEVALAQEACGDITCPKGYSCETGPGACPAILCDGPDCESPCSPTPVEYCVPSACASDAECGEAMLCAEHTRTVCEGSASPACAPDETCSDRFAADPSCSTESYRACTPRWQLPCASASDCGAGFSCREQEYCSTEPLLPEGRDANDPEIRRELEITCAPSGVFSCIAEQIECSSDADCPESWTCSRAGDLPCVDTGDGNPRCQAESPSMCQPPYSNLFATGGLASAGVEADLTGADAPLAEQASDSGAALAGSSGGCSLGTARTGATGFALSMLGAAALLGRRRRQARG